MTYFSHSPFKQNTPLFYPRQQRIAYNPQFNGWDSADDMPAYQSLNKKQNNKHLEKQKAMITAQKLNNNFVQKLIRPPTFNNQTMQNPQNNRWNNFYVNQVPIKQQHNINKGYPQNRSFSNTPNLIFNFYPDKQKAVIIQNPNKTLIQNYPIFCASTTQPSAQTNQKRKFTSSQMDNLLAD